MHIELDFSANKTCEDIILEVYLDQDKIFQSTAQTTQQTVVYDLDDVLYRYENHVMPTYEKYIKPFKNEADLIIPNNLNFDRAMDVLRTYLRAKSAH